MADPVKKFTMEDERISPPPYVYTPPRCACGNKIYKHEKVCKSCKRYAEYERQQPVDPYKASLLLLAAIKHHEIGRPKCEICGNQLSNNSIKMQCKKCPNCIALYGGL